MDDNQQQHNNNIAALRIRCWSKISVDKVMGGGGANGRARPDVVFSSVSRKFALCAELKWNRSETVEGAYRQMLEKEYLTKCKSLIANKIDVAVAVAIVGKPATGKDKDTIEVCIEKLINEEPKRLAKDFLNHFAAELATKYPSPDN